jgi:DnaK suppressor protein
MSTTMNDPSKHDGLGTLRERLTHRRRQLRGEIEAAEQAERESMEFRSAEVVDQKDQATSRQFTALEEVQERRDLEELAQVEAALQRLDLGAYGDCADCGESIPLQRLLVQPSALRCAACQAAHETISDQRGG